MYRFVVLFCFLIISISVYGENVNIQGTVSNEEGNPIPGAVVTLVGLQLYDTTDVEGKFTITDNTIPIHSVRSNNRTETVLLKYGIIKCILPIPSSVTVEVFDCRGTLLEKITKRNIGAGVFTCAISAGKRSTRIMTVRVTIGRNISVFRYFPAVENRRKISSQTENSTLHKTMFIGDSPVIDTLKIEADGYETAFREITSYSSEINASLKVNDEIVKPTGAMQIILYIQSEIVYMKGVVYDGRVPEKPWDTVETAGTLHLLTPRSPYCEGGCGSYGMCVDDNICQQYPSNIGAGKVTTSGLNHIADADTLSIISNRKIYTAELEYPPFNEGAVVTVSAAGSDDCPAFTLQAQGIAPLEMVTTSPVSCEDGKSLELHWTPPETETGSHIRIWMDLSYHGGTKAIVTGECEDNGTVIIPASLIDRLKYYGINGFPRIDMSRVTNGKNDNTEIVFSIEASVSLYLDIPGVVSCNDDSECPDGGACVDGRCQ